MKNILLVGGSGFVGYHLSKFFLKENTNLTIYIFDINPPINDVCIEKLIREKRIFFFEVDILKEMPNLNVAFDVIINLAAVHREPGHESHEYYETNLQGSENTIKYADMNGCKNLIFFSSISTYGPTESLKNELSLTEPTTPYGISKLISESIHKTWVSGNKKLLILRPGVIFGKHEKGNVSRMVSAIKKNYFFYTGNKEVFKSGIYVKEICSFIDWYFKNLNLFKQIHIVNLSNKPIPKLKDYVSTISKVQNKHQPIIDIPHFLLQLASHIINIPFLLFRKKNPFHPVRIKKLRYSNTIYPRAFEDLGYVEKYSFHETFEDWKKDDPELWK